MNTLSYSGPVEVIAICLQPGEKMLESICAAIMEHDIRNGVVVSGVATTKQCRMHYIEHTDFPPDNTVNCVRKPLEVGSINGIIADYEPHLHIVTGHKDRKCQAGHLEDDTVVAYLAEICIFKFNGMRMKRVTDPKRKIRLLASKRSQSASRKIRSPRQGTTAKRLPH